MICRPSDHTVERPRDEIRTRAGRPRGRDTTPRPPHLLIFYRSKDKRVLFLKTLTVHQQCATFLKEKTHAFYGHTLSLYGTVPIRT